LEQLADIAVELDHAVGIDPEPGLACRRRLEMRPHMHPGGIEVAEPGRALPVLAVDEIECGVEELLVNRFHAFGVERTRVLDRLRADPAELRINRRVVPVAGLALEDSAGAELRPEPWVLWVIGILRLLLGVEVIEIAEELIEAVNGGQMLVAVAEM